MPTPNGLTPSFGGKVGVGRDIAITAGGAEVLEFGTTGIGLHFGSGAPTVSAEKGSLYIRTDGSTTATRLYINSTGATAWVAITTAS